MAEDTFDLVVIGSGPAGYTGAIRASQLGFKVACVEKWNTLGGTCLNVGCIPSKALLESSELFHQARTKFEKHGIGVSELKLDLAQMMKRKDGVVRQLTNGVAGLFKKNQIESVRGHGRLGDVSGELKTVEVETDTGVRALKAKYVLLATGSEATSLPFLPFDGKRVLSSTEALSIPEVPKHLVVIGGGVIGLELGSVWARLGAKVTVIEYQDRILPGVDKGSALELQKALAKQGIEFKLASKCVGATQQGDWMVVEAEELAGGNRFKLECDYVLVSTGRRAYTDGLGLEKAGIPTDKLGRIDVDTHFHTSVPNVLAVGDIISGPMLAHKAEEEAVAAVEILAGQAGHVNYDTIPNVVYTWPEFASVGASEEELQEKGIEYKAGKFPFMANGRAKAMEEIEGFVKILADAADDRVLGVHMVGPRVSEMISEAVSVMEFGGSSEDIARTCHAHPTLTEVVKEAALAVHKRTLNL